MNCRNCGRFMTQVKPWEYRYDPIEVVVLCEYCGDVYIVDDKATEKSWKDIDRIRGEIQCT